jgi:predicted nucleotidyltransferase
MAGLASCALVRVVEPSAAGAHRLVDVSPADESLDRILAEAGIRFAYLFGSRVSGPARSNSDADVAVMPDHELGLLERERLAARLAAELAVPDVDVMSLDRAPLELRGRVVQHGELVYSSDEPARVAFEVRTRSEYFDFLPALERLQRGYLTHVADHGL